jgi:hypothetical protein
MRLCRIDIRFRCNSDYADSSTFPDTLIDLHFSLKTLQSMATQNANRLQYQVKTLSFAHFPIGPIVIAIIAILSLIYCLSHFTASIILEIVVVL